MEEQNSQNQPKSVQIIFYFSGTIQPFNKPAHGVKFKEEAEYIADQDFDWDKVMQYCQTHRRFVEKLCYGTNIIKDFSVKLFVNVIDPVDPKRITQHSSLRLIKNQAQSFYNKYASYVDKRTALSFSNIYDYIITGEPMPEKLREKKIDDDKGLDKDL